MMNDEMKSGYAVLIGRPNVGKSTLMNRLIGQKIAITSDKPQTTRNKIQTVYTDERGQIVFLDTPGVITKARNKLGEYMLNTTSMALKEADVVIWMVSADSYIGEGDRKIAQDLAKVRVPVILVVNKIDRLTQKEEVLPVIAGYSELGTFAEIVPVSALKETNTDDLLDTIFGYMPEGPMYFDEDTVTDQSMTAIAAEIIREKALRLLEDEIPHGIAVVTDRMEYRSDTLVDMEATIICERDTHKGIIIGKGGSMLKKIGSLARKDIEDMVECQVNLKLWVKVRDRWRDNETQMKNFGYNSRMLY